MDIGVDGLPGDHVARLVTQEWSPDPENAMTHHERMVEPIAQPEVLPVRGDAK
jgi:hypothetical protein